ncbi:MAG: (2Fe-2S)-binding protein [Ferruginibacter sp.]|nr:(2Fe-2S)-binding protein [Ferruginibacter sp.]
MIQFILNQKEISTGLPKGMLLLDFIRYHQRLTGTKIGCREGDCGACTVLTGELKNGELVYRSVTSCLMPLANAQGKHIVTVEGVNMGGLNFIQQCFSDQGATQCGFCTPGFIVSMAGYCLRETSVYDQSGVDAVNGNICRCTGYKSIERAVANIEEKLNERTKGNAINFAIENNILPAYFSTIKERLAVYHLPVNGTGNQQGNPAKFLGGGTDLYVQQHDTLPEEEIDFLLDKNNLKGIEQSGNRCILGASVTVTDILESPIFQQYFPALNKHIKLVSSTQIRNMATVAGNIINGSPIGDLTIFFLALDAHILLSDGITARELPLRKLFKGYKALNKTADEYIDKIYFELPGPNSHFNFEKVCKRTHLDIATVNSAIHLIIEDDIILSGFISAGGVGPVPIFLENSAAFLKRKQVSPEMITSLIDIAQSEISPISDARGTAMYKRLLLGQLIKAHFISLVPKEHFKDLMNA